MVITTCAISFGVSAEDETTDTSALEAFAAFMWEESTQAMINDAIGDLDETTDYITYSTSATIKESTSTYINYRGYACSDYDYYLMLVEFANLMDAAIAELMQEDFDTNSIDGNTTEITVWNTNTLRLALAQAMGEYVEGNSATTYQSYTCFTVLNYFLMGSNVATYNPTTSYAALEVETDSDSYVGFVVTTTDVMGYVEYLETNEEDYGLCYTLYVNGDLEASEEDSSTYIRTADEVVCGAGLDLVPTALLTSTTAAANALYTAAQTATSYFGECGATNEDGSVDEVYYYFDSSTGTLTIYGEGAIADMTAGEQPWYGFSSSITNLVIEEGVTKIGTNICYSFSSLKTISIPTTVTYIGQTAFYSTGLTSVAFPEGVETIWNGAFRYCYSIDTIYISSTVKKIYPNAFGGVANDGSFTAVYYRGTEAEYDLIDISSSSNPGLYDKSTTIYYSHVCSGSYVSTVSSPTCAEVGIDLYACSTCGVSYKVEVAATGHSFEASDYEAPTDTASTTYTPATCVVDGYWTVTCDNCTETQDFTNTDSSESAAHAYSETADSNSYASTCTDTGMNYFTCTVDGCGYILAVEVPVDTQAHNYVVGEYVAATCYKLGYTPYDCEYCTASYEVEDESSELLAHTDVNNDGICDVEECKEETDVHVCVVDDSKTVVTDATCTTGEITKTYCVYCEKLIEVVEGSNATGIHVSEDNDCVCDTEGCDVAVHTSEEVAEKAATCNEDGYTAGTKCSVCGEILTGCETIEAAHTGELTTQTVQPTCTENGYTYSYYTCCGDADAAKTAAYDAANAEDAVVTNDMKATGHSFTEFVEDSGTEGDCITTGSGTYKCANCDETTKIDGEYNPDVHNQTGEVTGYAATCIAAAYTVTYYPCCETSVTTYGEAATGIHTSTDGDCVCDTEGCNAEVHTLEEIAEVPATCGTAGTTAGTYCTVCKTTISGCETIPATDEHTYATADELEKSGDNYTAATCCLYDTWTNVKCSGCDETTTVYGSTYGDCSFTYDLATLTTDDSRYTKATTEANGYWTIKCDYCELITEVENEDSQIVTDYEAELAAAKIAVEEFEFELTTDLTADTVKAAIIAELEAIVGDYVKLSIENVDFTAAVEGQEATDDQEEVIASPASVTFTVVLSAGEETVVTIAMQETLVTEPKVEEPEVEEPETEVESHFVQCDGLFCTCICASDSAFIQFFAKIAIFFWKIFGINQYCTSFGCNGVHY